MSLIEKQKRNLWLIRNPACIHSLRVGGPLKETTHTNTTTNFNSHRHDGNVEVYCRLVESAQKIQ